jgi:hypothetical protein
MDREISDLLTHLDQYKQTHPTISIIWEQYLREKIASLKIAMSECRGALVQMQEGCDLTPNMVMLLYCLVNLETDNN